MSHVRQFRPDHIWVASSAQAIARIRADQPNASSESIPLDQASSSYLLAATDARWEGVGGRFIVDGKERRSSEDSYDEAQARRLWEMSWMWCGLDTLAAPDQAAQHA